MSKNIKENEDKLPEPEEMIAAATKHLQTENEQLRRKEYPGVLKNEAGKYYCPGCRKEIHPVLLETYHAKYCPECGKRIMMPMPYFYATSHKNEPAEER